MWKEIRSAIKANGRLILIPLSDQISSRIEGYFAFSPVGDCKSDCLIFLVLELLINQLIIPSVTTALAHCSIYGNARERTNQCT